MKYDKPSAGTNIEIFAKDFEKIFKILTFSIEFENTELKKEIKYYKSREAKRKAFIEKKKQKRRQEAEFEKDKLNESDLEEDEVSDPEEREPQGVHESIYKVRNPSIPLDLTILKYIFNSTSASFHSIEKDCINLLLKTFNERDLF